jgi:hypothetical protein
MKRGWTRSAVVSSFVSMGNKQDYRAGIAAIRKVGYPVILSTAVGEQIAPAFQRS